MAHMATSHRHAAANGANSERTALTPISPLMMTLYKPIPPVCTWILVSIQPVFETISDGGSLIKKVFLFLLLLLVLLESFLTFTTRTLLPRTILRIQSHRTIPNLYSNPTILRCAY
eukprot:scaffold15755_cov39-Attheya_sp.AAC.1